jgi:hypothetical protein
MSFCGSTQHSTGNENSKQKKKHEGRRQPTYDANTTQHSPPYTKMRSCHGVISFESTQPPDTSTTAHQNKMRWNHNRALPYRGARATRILAAHLLASGETGWQRPETPNRTPFSSFQQQTVENRCCERTILWIRASFAVKCLATNRSSSSGTYSVRMSAISAVVKSHKHIHVHMISRSETALASTKSSAYFRQPCILETSHPHALQRGGRNAQITRSDN